MMKVGVLAILFTGQTAEPSLQKQWFELNLSTDERDQLVEVLKKKPFSAIASILLRVLIDDQPLPPFGYYPPNQKPWHDEKLSPKHRTFFMAGEVWNKFIESKDNPDIARVLLSLLQKISGDTEKYLLITDIRVRQWSSD